MPLLGAWLYAGCYDVEGYSFECTGVFTNTVPTDAYRGAGRPEATYAIERAVDALARKLGKDPVEVRRLNFIREFPAPIASGLTIDSGDYDACLDLALEKSGYDDVRAEQRARRAAGDTKRLGIGLSTYVEMCGLAPSAILGAIRYSAGGWEAATIRCLPAGTVQVLTGSTPHGQGHETTWSQIVADRLGYEHRRGRGAPRRHLRRPARDGHVRQPLASRSAASRSTTRPSASSRRRRRSPRT